MFWNPNFFMFDEFLQIYSKMFKILILKIGKVLREFFLFFIIPNTINKFFENITFFLLSMIFNLLVYMQFDYRYLKLITD